MGFSVSPIRIFNPKNFYGCSLEEEHLEPYNRVVFFLMDFVNEQWVFLININHWYNSNVLILFIEYKLTALKNGTISGFMKLNIPKNVSI